MTQTANDQNSHGRIQDSLDSARDAAANAGARASETLDANPLAVLAGGLAVGAIAGALVPRSDKEKDLLRPVGARIGGVAAAAFAAAKEAGRTELENRGLTKDSARDQVKTLFQNVSKAASGAATAAVKSAKEEAGGTTGGQPDSTGGNGDSVPPINPHQQVQPGDRETSFSPSV